MYFLVFRFERSRGNAIIKQSCPTERSTTTRLQCNFSVIYYYTVCSVIDHFVFTTTECWLFVQHADNQTTVKQKPFIWFEYRYLTVEFQKQRLSHRENSQNLSTIGNGYGTFSIIYLYFSGNQLIYTFVSLQDPPPSYSSLNAKKDQ